MSSNNKKRDFRGRGKDVARSRGKHSLDSSEGGELRPFNPEALAVPEQEIDSSDPFAPSPAPATVWSPAADAATADAPQASSELEEAEASQESSEAELSAPLFGAHSIVSDAAQASPADSDAVAAGTLAAGAAANEVSQYSRENANYEARVGGWKGLSKGKKAAIIVVLILIVAAAIFAGVSIATLQNAAEEMKIEDPQLEEELAPVEDPIDPYWMLVLGSDARSGDDVSRSDVIMLARIDPNTPQVTLISIPRDTRVDIPGYGTDKINAAYAYGGASLAVKTISKYAGVKISHYAEVYFKGLEELVDGLGGVTVKVPEYCSYSDVTLQPGEQKLTGHEALIFARCRKTYAMGDFTRTKCQRILASAIINKILSLNALEMPSAIKSAAKCLSTDMELSEIVDLATRMQGMKKSSIYSEMSPSTTGMLDGVSYTFTLINQWKLIMQKADNGEDPELTTTEQEICGTVSTATEELDMKEGLPTDVSTKLQAYWDKKAARKAKKEAARQGSSNVVSTNTSVSSNTESSASNTTASSNTSSSTSSNESSQ